MSLRVLQDPEMVKAPILASPGFAKKGLSDYHLDLARRCAGQCSYCSTAATTPMRVHRERLKALALEQFGEAVDPTRDADIAIAWDADEVMRRLEAQLRGKPRGWLAGKVVMVSQLTDAFFGYPLASGLTCRALDAILASGVLAPVAGKAPGRLRVLTKSDVVGRDTWVSYFKANAPHFVVGLSTGTLNDEWATHVERATSKPTARLRALRQLQDAGVPTFGMLCPIFPDAATPRNLDALLDATRPELCETVWSEPYNDRDNWRAVRDGYEPGSFGHTWLTQVYEGNCTSLWSDYAVALWERITTRARRDGWAERHRYLLYEGDINQHHAPRLAGLDGVLLQSAPIANGDRAGYSANPHVAALQRSADHGRVATT